MTTTLQKIYAKIFDNGTKKINAKSVRESFALIDEKIGNISSGFQFSINPATPEPEGGWKKGLYPAEVSGIYPNQNNEEIDLSSGFSLLIFDGENWSKIVVGVDIVPIVERYVSLTDPNPSPNANWIYNDSYVDQDNGNIFTNGGFKASDFIPIPKWVKRINIGNADYNQFALYDINKLFVATDFSTDEVLDFDKPSSVYFIRITSADNELSKHQITFFNSDITQRTIAIQNQVSKTNLVTTDLKLTDGGYVDQDNGNIVYVSNYSYSAPVLIPLGSIKLILNRNNYQQYAFLDINGKYVSGSTAYENSIPSTARYIIFTVQNSDKPTFKIRFSSSESTIKTIEVSQSVNGNNAIQNALDAITDATSLNRYQVIVKPGIYKLTNSSQFTGNVPNYPSMILAKDHVDIIGVSKEDTVISAELPYNDSNIDTAINRDRHQTIYNWADDVLFKNLTFKAKYLRYTLHQDDPKEADKTRRYENCDFEYIGDKGSLRALGIGTFSGSKTYITEGKSINHSSAPFAIHNAANQINPSLWSFNNHEFLNYYTNEIMLVQNSGSLVGDKLELNNINFNGNTITYVDWWIYTPNSNDHFNHAEWRIVGSGNKPFYFKNELNGKALRITANTIGQKVRVDKNSTAYASIFGNNKSTFGPLGHPERKIVDGYVVQDFEGGFKSFAIGGLSIREDNYLFGTTTSQDSLGKRLGNCTSANKTLSVTVGTITISVLFNQNYTAQSNATIISAINSQLGSIATADEFDIGKDYFPELTDVNIIRANHDFVSIPKGTAVKITSGLIQIATDENDIAGIAIDDVQPRIMVQGEVKGFGRVVNNCILHKDSVRVQAGTSITPGKRYKSINGELAESTSGSILALDNNLLFIK